MFPGEVNLPGLKTVTGGMGKGVMVVVPALAEGQGGDPFVIAGRVTALIGNAAPAVGGGIDQPGDVIHDHQAQGNSPEHEGPAADATDAANPEQQHRQGQLQQQEIGVEPAVIGIAAEVATQAWHRLHGRNGLEHPSHVTPPEAAVTVVVISIRIRKLVVVAMQANPVDGAVLTAEGAAGGEKALQPGWDPEGSM